MVTLILWYIHPWERAVASGWKLRVKSPRISYLNYILKFLPWNGFMKNKKTGLLHSWNIFPMHSYIKNTNGLWWACKFSFQFSPTKFATSSQGQKPVNLWLSRSTKNFIEPGYKYIYGSICILLTKGQAKWFSVQMRPKWPSYFEVLTAQRGFQCLRFAGGMGFWKTRLFQYGNTTLNTVCNIRSFYNSRWSTINKEATDDLG